MGITKEQLVNSISQVKEYVDNTPSGDGKSAYELAVENGFQYLLMQSS